MWVGEGGGGGGHHGPRHKQRGFTIPLVGSDINVCYTLPNQANLWQRIEQNPRTNINYILQGSQYSVASDLWSLGLSLLEMALGKKIQDYQELREV